MALLRITRAQVLSQILAENPDTRIEGAWWAGERIDPVVSATIAQRIMGDEPDPRVREALVAGLGRSGDASRVDAILFAAQSDADGAVRAQAWLAMARVDRVRFEALAADASGDDPWQALGLAQGRLWTGDTRGVAALLDWARSGEPGQRSQASKALFKGLRPILDSAGHWPTSAAIGEGAVWTTEQVDTVRAAVGQVDLAALAADTWPHFESTERLRRDIRRINGARRRIAAVLFAGDGDGSIVDRHQ